MRRRRAGLGEARGVQNVSGGVHDARRAAGQDVNRTGVVDAGDRLPGHADGEIVEGIAVRIEGSDRLAQVVARIGVAGDPRRVLVPDRVAGDNQPHAHLAVEERDRAGGVDRADVLARGAHGEIVRAVGVEIPHRQRVAEQVAVLRSAGDTGETLPETADVRQAGAVPLEQHHPALLDSSELVAGGSRRQLVVAIAVEIAAGESRSQLLRGDGTERPRGHRSAAGAHQIEEQSAAAVVELRHPDRQVRPAVAVPVAARDGMPELEEIGLGKIRSEEAVPAIPELGGGGAGGDRGNRREAGDRGRSGEPKETAEELRLGSHGMFPPQKRTQMQAKGDNRRSPDP